MRQRLLVFLLSCLGTLLPTLAHAWWQEDWSYRKQISLDTTQQGAAITDQVGRIPLLVRLHTGNFSFDGVKANGTDLRFVAADDETVFNHRIESFDSLLGVAYIWVDVPEMQGGARQGMGRRRAGIENETNDQGQLNGDDGKTCLDHQTGHHPADAHGVDDASPVHAREHIRKPNHANAADHKKRRTDEQQPPTEDFQSNIHQISPSSSPPVGRPMWENSTYLETAMVPMKLISA